ncbi:MAG TPA: hybrid sensor histidine kinase/response regulator [Dictyobacter sp.]|nr:hybrid sensor histidine kinase/response regulator [Dictyobacter sp.]
MHVLLVDDDQALLQALPRTLALRMQHVQVDAAETAQRALDLLSMREYDAIICDVKLPGMSGLDLLVKAHEVQPETPVLLVTGHDEHPLAIEALRRGAYDYIVKPIDRDSFVAALRRALQTRQLRRQVQEKQRAVEQYASSLEQLVEQRTAELQNTNAELTTTSAAKDAMLRMVVHELAGPLGSLKGMTQYLLLHAQRNNDAIPPPVHQGLTSMERSLGRLELLVQDLQDTFLIQTNRFTLHRHRWNLVELCQMVLDEFNGGDGPVSASALPDFELLVDIDVQRMSQVLLNLLSNARKYSPDQANIVMTLRQEGNEAIISVQDHGVGIPAAALPHIYDQFYRVPGLDVQRGPASGLGLGLYIARAIVAQHEGRLEVESQPGQGSTFSVVLPLVVEQYLVPVYDAAQVQWVLVT